MLVFLLTSFKKTRGVFKVQVVLLLKNALIGLCGLVFSLCEGSFYLWLL
ncbi:hypothetical protein CLV24_11131 [Pontibacter ummariensis]|uniref:Uncharacterized protein n=1 Tax=Pontibacter ummariensis TaxID=1610492 RepID=A0A239GF29_9BACT|nr:hypothetical protein CLV24_11131 [Pontibacter ummariensis]SNS67750.1 hypothetical protein SAMN06296052_11131 [Pontibacter ummariensis]